VTTNQEALQQPSAPPAAANPASEAPPQADGDLVVLQQNVLATVDHAFGNIFQRLYHLIRTVRAGSGPTLPALEDSVRELQSLLELFMDYVTPTSLETRMLRTADVGASFRRHFEEQVGDCRLTVDVGEEHCGTVLADPARLARVFHLLAQLVPAQEAIRSRIGLSATGTQYEIALELPRFVNSAASDLRWVLSQKLIELQGGELRRLCAAERDGWTLRLPLAT
jgi:hypothetical protein